MDLPSQCDVMKLRPYPGTTILFCAIKENPTKKLSICRPALCSRMMRGLAGGWCNDG
jgi:hypothetical protein